MSQKSMIVFIVLVVLVIVLRGITFGNIYAALGASIVEVPAGILLGRAALWLIDQVALFVANLRNPDNPRQKFERDIWRTLSISLVIGVPLWALVSTSPG